MPFTTQQIALAARPAGMPTLSDFRLETVELPDLREGQALMRSIFLSLDPYMRGRMSEGKSYAAPLQIGDTLMGEAIGEVLESRAAGFRKGDIVAGYLGWRAHAVLDAGGLRKLDDRFDPISTALGVMGMVGLTAYHGLFDVGALKPGESVFVSGAAGAVGSIVGQMAKINGSRVAGSAGTDEKVRHLTEDLGFDAAFNYKTESDCTGRLQELFPEGIDVYFDNVGGAVTDAAILNLKVGGRVAVCGQISQYNLTQPEMGPRLFGQLIARRARIQGFLVGDFAAKNDEALTRMAQWRREGRLHLPEHIAYGIENAPAAFIGMLQGENTGKQLVQISEPPAH